MPPPQNIFLQTCPIRSIKSAKSIFLQTRRALTAKTDKTTFHYQSCGICGLCGICLYYWVSKSAMRADYCGKFSCNIVGYNPLDNYDILKAEGGWSSYEGYSNDVARGEAPELLERHLAGRGYNVGLGNRNDAKTQRSPRTTESLREKLGIDRSGSNQGDFFCLSCCFTT